MGETELRLNYRVGDRLNYHVGHIQKDEKKRENRIDSSALFSFEKVCRISVQTVDDSVSKTFKIGVSICQSEDFFDQ